MEGPELAEQGTAIIVGYGRFGQTVAQMLFARGFSVTLIDRKPAQIELSGRFDMKVYYGDGTRVDLLRNAGAENASLIAFCIDDPSIDAKELEPVMSAFPQAAMLVRAFDRRHMIRLMELELTGVVREVYESAVSMGRTALSALGVPDEEIADLVDEFRANDRERFDVQVAAGDLMAAKDLMYRPGREMVLRSREVCGEEE
jgi:CPA2 family monovalent cation:H+ antiporter-2